MLWTLSNKASNAKIRDNWRSESLPQLLLHFVNIPSTSEIWPFKHLMHSADIVKETKLRTERGSHRSCRSLSEIVGVCAGAEHMQSKEMEVYCTDCVLTNRNILQYFCSRNKNKNNNIGVLSLFEFH